MALNDDALRILSQLREDLATITNRQTRDLVGAWARAWDEVSIELDATLTEIVSGAPSGTVSRATMLRSQRLADSLSAISEQLDTLARQAGIIINGDLPQTVRLALQAQGQIVAVQMPPPSTATITVTFNQLDDDALAAIVRRTTEQITARTLPLSTEASTAIRRELVRGVTVGANPRVTARRMVQRTEGRFNGGLARALTIARTETLDAQREAARARDVANADTLRGWTWVAEASRRTCPACWAMHGTEHPVADPGPLGHPNCRCARVPITKSWRDLGIDLDEPDVITINREQAFAALSRDDQILVLGPSRHAAWSRGDLSMDDWVQRRSADGWRDSYVVAPLPSRPSARLAS